MKKITKFLFASLLVLATVAGCEQKEEEKVITFEEYLNSQETLSAAKLDEKVGAIDLNTNEYLTTIDIPNSKASISVSGGEENESLDAYLWAKQQSDGKYAYFVIGDEDGVAGYEINLKTIDSLLNAYKLAFKDQIDSSFKDNKSLFTDSNNSNKLEISELLNNYFSAMGLDTTVYNVNTILSKVKFVINDFEYKGNNVYELKNSSIVSLLKTVTGKEDLLPDTAVETLNNIGNVQVTYDKNVIQQVKIAVNLTDYEDVETENDASSATDVKEIKYNFIIKLDFEYDKDDKLVKTTVDFTETVRYEEDTEYFNAYVVFGKNQIEVGYSGGEYVGYPHMQSSLSIATTNGKTTIKSIVSKKLSSEGALQEILNAEVNLVANWLSDAKVTTKNNDEYGNLQTVHFEITNSVNVDIPSTIKSAKSTDVTTQVGQAIIDFIEGLFIQ